MYNQKSVLYCMYGNSTDVPCKHTFISHRLVEILFPTLICACYHNDDNKAVLQQEISCQLILMFIKVSSRDSTCHIASHCSHIASHCITLQSHCITLQSHCITLQSHCITHAGPIPYTQHKLITRKTLTVIFLE
jgi:hypothetical protein